jgi:uncharacterized protein (TIGR02996 family)
MSDRDALLAAILANPDDDLPRLVYADWLDENAAALPPPERKSAADRAAFIRAQVEAARAEPFSPTARAAKDRADRLLTPAHREQWTRHLRGLVQEPEMSRFARGFVEGVTVDPGWFRSTAAALFDAEAVRSLRVERPWSYDVMPLEPFFELPDLRHVTGLELPALHMMNVEYDALLASPHLDQLTHLSLRGNPVFPPWLVEFLAGPRLPNLRSLDLSDIPNLGPAITAGLVGAGHRRLTRLDLPGVAFRSGDLKHLLDSPCLSEVEELRLGWGGGAANPGPLTHLEFAWVIRWDRLRLLDLSGQGLGPDGVRQIARVPAAANLRWLGLARNGLGSEGARVLLEPGHLNPYHLDVRGNSLGVKEFAALQRRFPEAKIEF